MYIVAVFNLTLYKYLWNSVLQHSHPVDIVMSVQAGTNVYIISIVAAE